MQKKIVSICIICLSFSLWTNAQDSQPKASANKNKIWVMGVPQYLFQHGMRIETDFAINPKNEWITLAPTLYFRNKRDYNGWFSNHDEAYQGLGLELFYRKYFKTSPNVYYSVGGGYSIISLKKSYGVWESYQEDGATYYVPGTENYNATMETATARAVLGYKAIIDHHLAVDFYAGMGFKFSNFSTPENVYLGSNEIAPWGMGHSGYIFVGGIRFGVGW